MDADFLKFKKVFILNLVSEGELRKIVYSIKYITSLLPEKNSSELF